MSKAEWNVRQTDAPGERVDLERAVGEALGPVCDRLLNDPMGTLDWEGLYWILIKAGHQSDAEILRASVEDSRIAMERVIDALNRPGH